MPREPKTWEEYGLDPTFGEQLVLRFLLGRTSEASRTVASELCLAYPLVKEILEGMKATKLTIVRGSTATGDFQYELTEAGRTKAVEAKKATTYVGPAPVVYEHFLRAMRAQSTTQRTPSADDLIRAFSDLAITRETLRRLGPAVASGKAMFLFGEPGNGKTSLAERITRAFGDTIWIPHAISIDGHLIKIFDPAIHEQVEFTPSPGEKLDGRWVHVKRPTVIAGGELTMEMLDIQADLVTNVHEPPMQMKAMGGTLVIDDFGRGRVPPKEMLNRWIFPLEKRVDFLRLPDGRKIHVPFDCLLVFSTNLKPHDLADEAFLRRIPYKIKVADPTEAEFRAVLDALAKKMGMTIQPGAIDHLLERHYRAHGRPLRFCHPRDLLQQVASLAAFERRAPTVTTADLDLAVANYFGGL